MAEEENRPQQSNPAQKYARVRKWLYVVAGIVVVLSMGLSAYVSWFFWKLGVR